MENNVYLSVMGNGRAVVKINGDKFSIPSGSTEQICLPVGVHIMVIKTKKRGLTLTGNKTYNTKIVVATNKQYSVEINIGRAVTRIEVEEV